MQHDVFISYSTIDAPVADAIASKLEMRGVRCWYAPRDISAGRDWASAISDAIATSEVMVLVFSTNANRSQHVLDELNLAIDEETRILPFRIANLDPSGAMRLHLSSRHWLDAFSPSWMAHLDRLAESVEALLLTKPADASARPSSGKRPPRPSPTRLTSEKSGTRTDPTGLASSRSRALNVIDSGPVTVLMGTVALAVVVSLTIAAVKGGSYFAAAAASVCGAAIVAVYIANLYYGGWTTLQMVIAFMGAATAAALAGMGIARMDLQGVFVASLVALGGASAAVLFGSYFYYAGWSLKDLAPIRLRRKSHASK